MLIRYSCGPLSKNFLKVLLAFHCLSTLSPELFKYDLLKAGLKYMTNWGGVGRESGWCLTPAGWQSRESHLQDFNHVHSDDVQLTCSINSFGLLGPVSLILSSENLCNAPRKPLYSLLRKTSLDKTSILKHLSNLIKPSNNVNSNSTKIT